MVAGRRPHFVRSEWSVSRYSGADVQESSANQERGCGVNARLTDLGSPAQDLVAVTDGRWQGSGEPVYASECWTPGPQIVNSCPQVEGELCDDPASSESTHTVVHSGLGRWLGNHLYRVVYLGAD